MINIFEKIIAVLINYKFLQLLVLSSTPFIVAFLGYIIFLKQKEYEYIRKRYLDEGFDKLISEYDNALSIYRYNWAISLSIIQQIRDLPRDTINTKLLDEYISIKSGLFPTVAVHRLNNLIPITEIWKKHQSFYSFIHNSYKTFTCDVYVGIKCYIEHPEKMKADKDTIFTEFFNQLKSIDKSSNQWDFYLGQVKQLASIFEEAVFSKKSLKKFKNRDDVKSLLIKISDSFTNTT